MQSNDCISSLPPWKCNQRKKENKVCERLQFTCIINLPAEFGVLSFLPLCSGERNVFYILAHPVKGCVCVWVCVREREREGGKSQRDGEREREGEGGRGGEKREGREGEREKERGEERESLQVIGAGLQQELMLQPQNCGFVSSSISHLSFSFCLRKPPTMFEK